MEPQVEAALLECLERLGNDRPIDPAWVRRTFPGCEREIEEFLALQRCLEEGRPVDERVGPYRLLRRLGRGGMGTVFLACAEDGRRVAVKVLHESVIRTREGVERALAEAHAGSAVRHPNVVRLLDFGIDGGSHADRVYLVFEAVSGQTLRGLLDERGAVEEACARHIGSEVAAALAAVHAAGLVHGDVKPENVVLAEGEAVRLLDLGAVRGSPGESQATDDLFVGSMLYAAPEQLAPGPEPIDGRADLHALGLVLYELVTGRHPFGRARFPDDPGGPIALRRDDRLSPFLARVLERLLALDRRDRQGSAAWLRDVLRDGERSSSWARVARAPRAAGLEPRVLTPLRGRERELAVLRGAVSTGALVLVEGGPGIGKSRLLEEVAAAGEADEAYVVLRGSFAQGDALAIALHPYVSDGALPVDARSRAVLQAYTVGAPLDSRVDLADLRAAVWQLMRGWTRQRHVLVLIDDLHLADADGRARIEQLAGMDEPAFTLIAAARPELRTAWREQLVSRDRVSVLQLGPLSAEAVRRLVTDSLGGEPSERLVRWCADHSRGHPLLAREALHWMNTEGGRLSDAGGVWHLIGDLEGVPPSDSVREVVRARLDRLPPAVRDVLDAASCVGAIIDTGRLADVLGIDAGALDERLSEVEREHGLVVRSDGGFSFEQHLVREVLHEDLHPALRRQLHSAWAQALRVDGGTADGALAAELIPHLIEAGRGEAALGLLDAAVAHLEDSVRPHAALDLLERLLDHFGEGHAAERVVLLRKRAQRLMRFSLFDEFDATMERAWELANAAPTLEQARLHDLHVKRRLMAGDTRSVRRDVQRARELAGKSAEVPADLEASLTHNLAKAAWFEGRAADAHGLFRKTAELARQAGDRERESHAGVSAASALGGTASPEESLAAATTADAFAQAHASALTRAYGRRTMGHALRRIGRTRDCVAAYEEALDLCVRAGNRTLLPSIEIDLANVLASAGRYEEARKRTKSATQRAEEVGATGFIAYAHMGHGDLLMELGEFDAACSAFLRAARVLRRQGAPVHLEPISRIATLRAAQGRFRESLGAFERATEGIVSTQFARVVSGFRVAFAETCLAVGDLERARELASAARTGGGGGAGSTEARALAVEAACAWHDDHSRAEQLTQSALGLTEAAKPSARLQVVRTAVCGWMAFHRPADAAELARSIVQRETDGPRRWLRALPLAVASRVDPAALQEARTLLDADGHRIPLLDRIAAHAHVWLVSGREADLAGARRLLPALEPSVDLERAVPSIRQAVEVAGSS